MKHLVYLLLALAACKGRDIPVVDTPDAAGSGSGSDAATDAPPISDNDLAAFQHAAQATATQTATTPLACTYDGPSVHANVSFSVSVGALGGFGCTGYSDCPYDFSWLFMDLATSGTPKTFSMIAAYRPGEDSLIRTRTGTATDMTDRFDYVFSGFYNDNLVLTVHTLAKLDPRVTVEYIKTDGSGSVVLHIACTELEVHVF